MVQIQFLSYLETEVLKSIGWRNLENWSPGLPVSPHQCPLHGRKGRSQYYSSLLQEDPQDCRPRNEASIALPEAWDPTVACGLDGSRICLPGKAEHATSIGPCRVGHKWDRKALHGSDAVCWSWLILLVCELPILSPPNSPNLLALKANNDKHSMCGPEEQNWITRYAVNEKLDKRQINLVGGPAQGPNFTFLLSQPIFWLAGTHIAPLANREMGTSVGHSGPIQMSDWVVFKCS